MGTQPPVKLSLSACLSGALEEVTFLHLNLFYLQNSSPNTECIGLRRESNVRVQFECLVSCLVQDEDPVKVSYYCHRDKQLCSCWNRNPHCCPQEHPE